MDIALSKNICLLLKQNYSVYKSLVMCRVLHCAILTSLLVNASKV